MIRTALFFLCLAASTASAQELFIQTEPASNMPAGRFGLRVSSDIWNSGGTYSRLGSELMYGVSKELMVHAQAYGSNQLTGFALETFGIYAKYRFFNDDGFKYHLRLAAFGDVLGGEQHSMSPSLSFKGAGPAASGGLIATLLEHRLALSTTLGASRALKDITFSSMSYSNITGANASLSIGYLVYPPNYTGYSDPNVNLYTELLGYHSWYDHNMYGTTTSLEGTELLVSFGAQLILNSVARFDLAYVPLIHSNFTEQRPNTFFARFEYNFY